MSNYFCLDRSHQIDSIYIYFIYLFGGIEEIFINNVFVCTQIHVGMNIISEL